MKHGYESSDNFANMLGYVNSCQHNSSDSINKLDTSGPDPESRSNSITSDDIDDRIMSKQIPIPLPNTIRKRETMCDGTSALDLHNMTPTPTKHMKMLEDNAKNIGSLINLYYENINHKLSPYSK